MKVARGIRERLNEGTNFSGPLPGKDTLAAGKGRCHIWTRYLNKGYGGMRIGSKTNKTSKIGLTHRLSWELDVGPIPKGMFIDHMCRNTACLNVNHLRVVTPKVNATENAVGNWFTRHKLKTKCPKGHKYDVVRSYKSGPRKGRSYRACTVCENNSYAKYRESHREVIRARNRRAS